jgi:hypothetical protein
MSRENNIYVNRLSGERLNVTEMSQFINSEARRQYEECSGENWDDMTIDEQQECIHQQWEHQINDMDWRVFT